MKDIKICYIGGGSKQWARFFMTDLALAKDMQGEVALYDIENEIMECNQIIGNKWINNDKNTISKWQYNIYDRLEDALKDATFVIISILPATFLEMKSDVHTPEKYGIYQAVGDTVGPGGILRAMRTVPIYEDFAIKIKNICPKAWVINLTNPMSICTKTLYDCFPDIKAFGCCHEVFHAQEFLCLVAEKELNIKRPKRTEIYTDASGINHFTWITEAKYNDIDLLSLIPSFSKKYFEDGYYEYKNKDEWKTDTFAYGNKVKMDLFDKYKALPAAGDRHLVEFLNNKWYLENAERIYYWRYSLTSVDFRIKQQNERIEEAKNYATGSLEFKVEKSDEEIVDLLRAILGLEKRISNVNMPNNGQMPDFPKGIIVETNCIFTNDCVKPIVSKSLPDPVKNLVLRNAINIETTYEGIKNRDLKMIFNAFINQPLCSGLSFDEANSLFKEMICNTRKYLDAFFGIDKYINA